MVVADANPPVRRMASSSLRISASSVEMKLDRVVFSFFIALCNDSVKITEVVET